MGKNKTTDGSPPVAPPEEVASPRGEKGDERKLQLDLIKAIRLQTKKLDALITVLQSAPGGGPVPSLGEDGAFDVSGGGLRFTYTTLNGQQVSVDQNKLLSHQTVLKLEIPLTSAALGTGQHSANLLAALSTFVGRYAALGATIQGHASCCFG